MTDIAMVRMLEERDAEIERLQKQCDGLAQSAMNNGQELLLKEAAIRSTASQGTYDEVAIRKAVSFELAELIVDARRAVEPKP